ncbi:MAG TPA: hypothetical protein VHF25_14460 [Nitriliruptorales bacterium]|nr:hypothetical protein [Nitriliruptorales bacterium]
MVVHDDVDVRARLRAELTGHGYDVVTCPGPHRTTCPAISSVSCSREPCPHVPNATMLVTIDSRLIDTHLPCAYMAWLPAAHIEQIPA